MYGVYSGRTILGSFDYLSFILSLAAVPPSPGCIGLVFTKGLPWIMPALF